MLKRVEAEPPRAGALAATWLRMRQTGLRQLWVVGALCLGISLFLIAVAGGGFVIKLVYSLAIGAACTLIVNSTRLLVAWGNDRARASRGLPYTADISGWYGAIPGALLAMLVGPSIGLTLADWITGYPSPSLLQLDATSTRLTLALSVLGTAVSVVVFSTMERLSAARAQAEAAQRQAAEHQLRLLLLLHLFPKRLHRPR